MGNRSINLAGLFAVLSMAPPVLAQTTRPAESARQPALILHLISDGRNVPPASPALGGAPLDVLAVSTPHRACRWILACRDRRLGGGQVLLNGQGMGPFAVTQPDVRVRTTLVLQLFDGERMSSRAIEVIPARPLSQAAELIGRMQLGVLDAGGRLQAALTDQKVAFEDLAGDLRQDAFAGGAVLLSGVAEADELAEACHRLAGRIRDGMIAVILAPPPSFRAWGASVAAGPQELSAPVAFSPAIGRFLRPEDLATVQWAGSLRVDRSWQALAWCQDRNKDAAGHRSPAANCVLLAARPLGKGWVCLVAPRMRAMDPLHDAVDRTIANEVVLWTLAVYHHTDDQSGGRRKGGRP
ncbi:MAG: hypothetical protein BIFFINMI_02802 [Phycisphaerae bacterium]|nr:hypothetical protein [Phycisphaerae bacterium]